MQRQFLLAEPGWNEQNIKQEIDDTLMYWDETALPNEGNTTVKQECSPDNEFTLPTSSKRKRTQNVKKKVQSTPKVQQAPKCTQENVQKGNMNNLTEVARQLAETLKSPYVEMIRCPVCAKELRSSHNVGMHMKMHTGNYNIRCEICQQGFRQRSKLLTHMKKHGTLSPNMVKEEE